MNALVQWKSRDRWIERCKAALLVWAAFFSTGSPAYGQSNGEPHADDYLFGLTREKIEEMAEFYAHQPAGELNLDHVFDQLRAPFDPTRYGDLLEEVGPAATFEIIEQVVSLALQRVPEPILLERVEQLAAIAEAEWFQFRFPNGVPDDDPYWGDMGGQGFCSRTAFVSGGDRRLRAKCGVKKYVFWFSLYARSSAYTYTGGSLWLGERVVEICVDGSDRANRQGGGHTVKTFSDCNYDASSVREGTGWSVFTYSYGSRTINATGEATDSVFGALSVSVCYP